MFTGKKTCFLGVETDTWTHQQFIDASNTIKAAGFDSVAVKFFDGPNLWYGGFTGSPGIASIVAALSSNGLQVLLYGYLYGNNKGSSLETEVNYLVSAMTAYGAVMGDIEEEFNGDVQSASYIRDRMKPAPGQFFVTTWANPVVQNWIDVALALAPCVNGWYPQVYTPSLVSVWAAQWANGAAGVPLIPVFRPATLDEAAPAPAYALWEYQDIAQSYGGTPVSNVPLNARGEVANIVTPSQFEYMETQFACGFYVAAEARYMTAPNVANTTPPETIDTTADVWYDLEYGGHGIDKLGGVSIDDMHRMFTASGLKYADMTAINPGSAQSSDIEHIKATLAQGYPIAATVTEVSVYDLDLQGNPYAWGAAGTHVVLYVGIDTDGALLVHDTASIEGPLNGANRVRSQPRRYDINRIGTQWASAVCKPLGTPGGWLPIPPPAWDATKTVINPPATTGGNEDVSMSIKKVANPSEGQQKQATDTWNYAKNLFPALPALNENTGIANAWKQTVYNGRSFGIPLGPEYDSVDWSMKPIRRQDFSGGWIEWENNTPRLFVYGMGELKLQ